MSDHKSEESTISFKKTEKGPIFTVTIPLYGFDNQVQAYGVMEIAKEQLQRFYMRREFENAKRKESEGIIKPPLMS